MANRHPTPPLSPGPEEISTTLSEIANTSKRLAVNLASRNLSEQAMAPFRDDLGISKTFLDMQTRLLMQPMLLAERQMSFWQDTLSLWQHAFVRLWGGESQPVAAPEADDRRFKDDAWNEYLLFDLVKQSYLIASRWLQTTISSVDDLDEQELRKIEFYTRQYVDALAPTNFVLTNPEVLRETYQSGGYNLLKGLRNLLHDLERSQGPLRIRMTDNEAFTLGVNVAVTPGKVVFQNRMLQLIQYQPSTDKVLKRPLLIVPPWINKYYILDLRPKNSFIKWAVDQGHTVFVISWVNPTAEYADTGFDDYLTEGTLAALDAIEQATGEHDVNAIGYCLGGTLLSATLGYLAASGDERIKAASFFTTLIDFSQPGELGVFLDEQQVSSLEQKMAERGYLEGSEMATTFNMLRANDLIWSFFINNYLLGKDPFPFDLLYWNSDSTRMPAKMHSFYLRNMYLENRLKEPGGVTLAGQAVDLGKVKTPAYFLSAIEDHIAPWKSTYGGTRVLAGPIRFVLGASGHIAGVINPPTANKYHYWTHDEQTPPDSNTWLAGAKKNPGSWWPDWQNWVSGQDKRQVNARQPGDGKLTVIEDAPGRYAQFRLG